MAKKKQVKSVMTDRPSRAKKASPAATVYQFKITLLDTQPAVWRRMQVKDCTLDKLHEHIQTAMGWTNSHLHQFKFGEQLYGDPMLMQENFEEMEYEDSTSTKVSVANQPPVRDLASLLTGSLLSSGIAASHPCQRDESGVVPGGTKRGQRR